MTIDERLEFLLRSSEWLHESVFENTRQIAQLTRKVDGLANAIEQDAKNIRGLVRIAELQEHL